MISPALEVRFPAWSKTVRLSLGEAKLARLKTLKNSARNCTLKFSDIFRTRLFLNNEKSKFERPGPISVLRPKFPRRFAQVPATPRLPGSVGPLVPGGLKPKVVHREAIAGAALGRLKQLLLMY